MKTIEVNLIGDLRQKTVSKKASPAASVAQKAATPGEARNTLILFGVGGSATFLLIMCVLIGVVCLLISFGLDGTINKTDTTIEQKNAELSKLTKIKNTLLEERKDLVLKFNVKKLLTTKKFPLAEVLEELRAKIPGDIYLTNVKKAKAGLMIKGSVSPTSLSPLKSISYFVLNINTMQPEASLVTNAILANVSTKEGGYNFSIKADIKDLNAPPSNENTETKKP